MSEFSFPLSALRLSSSFHRVERGIEKRRKLSNPKSENLSSIIIIGISLRSMLLTPVIAWGIEIQITVWTFGLIALYCHRRRFLSASLLIIPSSLRRKINKGRKLRKMPKSSEVLNSPLHPHCAPCCFPLRSANSGSAAAEQKVVLPWRRGAAEIWKFHAKNFPRRGANPFSGALGWNPCRHGPLLPRNFTPNVRALEELLSGRRWSSSCRRLFDSF